MTRSPSYSSRPGFEQLRLIRPPDSFADSVYVVETAGTVAALSPSGDLRWRRPVVAPRQPMMMQAALAVLGEHLVAKDGEELMGLDRGDGSQLWRQPFPAILPLAHFDGVCLWGFRGDKPGSIRDPGTILALELETGTVRPGPRRPRYIQIVASTEELVVLRDELIRLIGIDKATGEERWRLEVPQAAGIHALGRGGSALIKQGDLGIFSIDLATGQREWECNFGSRAGRLLLVGDRLHIYSTWRWLELDASNGAILADTQVTEPDVRRVTSTGGELAHHDGIIYGASLDGTVWGWDLASHTYTWTHNVGAKVEWACTPKVFLDALWIMDAQGALHVFELG